MSESRPGYGSSEFSNQLSFLAPDDALTLHHLRHLVAEAHRIYETRTGFDPREAIHLRAPADVYRLLAPLVETERQEQLHVLSLTTKNHVIAAHLVYQGTISGVPVRLAEVFRPAIIDAAAGIVVSHNHPSGDPTPSPDDIRLSRQMTAAGKLLDIEVLDHIVIGRGRFVSLKEMGLFDGSVAAWSPATGGGDV
jgi:DNA repair protein RadC